jgi:hypothetical protein
MVYYSMYNMWIRKCIYVTGIIHDKRILYIPPIVVARNFSDGSMFISSLLLTSLFNYQNIFTLLSSRVMTKNEMDID